MTDGWLKASFLGWAQHLITSIVKYFGFGLIGINVSSSGTDEIMQ